MKNSTRTIDPSPIRSFSPPAIGQHAGGMTHGGQSSQVVPMGEVVGQTLAGLTPMNGQNISVNVSSASPHLPMGEWIKRGILSALGNGLMFFPRLLGRLFEALLMGVLGIVKVAVIIVLVPTLIWAGYHLQQHLSNSGSVREGAASATVQGGEVLKGIVDGSKADSDPLAAKAAGKDQPERK